MVRTINTEVGILVLIGFLLTVAGIYLNFQNLDNAQSRHYPDPGQLTNNEIIYGLIQIIGMALIFVGATRGMLRRSDIMSNKFVNIMDVYSSLIKKQLEVIDDKECRQDLKEIDERSNKFKREMSSLKRL
jgi:hypothetical protein